MEENQPVPSSGTDPAGVDAPPPAFQFAGPPAGSTRWQKFRWLAARLLALLGGFLVMGAVFTAFAGWYTSRPEFCRSCHIMEPYYVSWQESTHSQVSCIKCHFPPGVGEKVRGKMLGLVQLAQYVTSSAGPRPAAEIPDASCLRSGCHETRLLAGRIDFNGIPFDHAPHMGQLRRGKQLLCTSCHSQIVQGSHMTVTPTTCYLCHFKDGYLNEGLGACNRCHQIPERSFDLGGGVQFDHQLAYERGVNCAQCHADLIRGNGEVPAERCTVCHNRADDLARIGDSEFLHRKHVTDHSVDCLSCHLQIHHELDPHRLETATADCASCHPNQHREQIKLLTGVGARSLETRPSSMIMSGIACGSCHREQVVSPTGTILWTASTASCLECHDQATAARLLETVATLQTSLPQLQQDITRVREALAAAELPAERSTELSRRLDDVQYDVEFLRVGNGVHNIHYAGSVVTKLVEELAALCRELGLDEPQISLPASPDAPEAEMTEAEEAEPEGTEPEMVEPEAAPPEAAAPEVAAPEVAAPEVAAPEVAAPEVAAPEAAAPEAAEPEAAAPEVAAPESAEPESAEPEMIEPADATEEAAGAEPQPPPEPGPPEPGPPEVPPSPDGEGEPEN